MAPWPVDPMQGGQAAGPTTQPHGTSPGDSPSTGQPAPYTAAPYGSSYGSSYGAPAPQYGSYGYGAPAVAQRTNGKAVASFVLSLIGLLLIPLIPSIIAVILGHSARNEIKNDPTQGGGGLAVAGLVIGWINIGLILLVGLFFLFMFAAFASAW